MAALGYIASSASGQDLEAKWHQYGPEYVGGAEWKTVFFGSASGGNWNWWRKDGATPSVGAEGGWTIGALISDKDSGHSNIHWDPDNDIGATLTRHATDDKIRFWGVDGSNNLVETETLIDSAYGNADDVSVVQGNDGRVHIAEITTAVVIKSTNTARTSLGAATTPTGPVTPSACIAGVRFTDGTDWYVGFVYRDTDGTDSIAILYCKDGDDPSTAGNWTDTEILTDAAAIDDHLGVCAGELSAESFSRLLVVYKDASDVVNACKGSFSGGSWSFDASVEVQTSRTRPDCSFTTTGDAFVFYLNGTSGGSTTIVQGQESLDSMDGTLSFSNETDYIRAANETDNMSHVKSPSNAYGAAADLFILGFNNTTADVWYAIITITAPAGGATPKGVFGLALDGPHRRVVYR